MKCILVFFGKFEFVVLNLSPLQYKLSMRITNILVFFVFFMGLFAKSQGQVAKSYSNEFLSIGVGARAHAMGGAVVATARDINAGYWNPAGLSHIESPLQVGAMHAEWFAGIVKYDHVSVAKQVNPEKKSVAGISLIRMGVDNIPNTLQIREPDGSINYDLITSFSVADYAFMGHYAQQLGDSPWSLGGNVKIIHRSIGSFSKAWGFGLDMGLQYNKNQFSFGLMGRDVTSTYNAWRHTLSEEDRKVFNQTGNSLPDNSIELTLPSLIAGFSYLFLLGENYNLLVAADMRFTTDGQRNTLLSNAQFAMDPALGLEAFYKNLVGLRMGFNNAQRYVDDFGLEARERWTIQPNFGLGLHIKNVTIDYAIANLGNSVVGQLSHIFSVRMNIFPKVKA
jgi:hypothetical protein